MMLVEVLPLHGVTVVLQVLSEGGATIGHRKVRQQGLQRDGVSVLIQEGAYDGHQPGEGLRVPAIGVHHDTLWPQGGAQAAQQETHLHPLQAEHCLEEDVELHTSHHTHLWTREKERERKGGQKR